MPRRRRAANPKATDSAPEKGKRRRSRAVVFSALLRGLVARSVNDLVKAINQNVRGDMAAEVRAFIAENGGSARRVERGRQPARAARKRIRPCIAPGCQNPSKGPRFHYLCEKHMGAPKKDYEAWRLKAKEARSA